MDFTNMTLKERANHCLNIYDDKEGATPKCADNFMQNQKCDYICCGYCPDYTGCNEEKCRQVWIDARLIMDNPAGRLCYIFLETGRLVSGSVPCLISDMYDDNE